MSISLSTEEDLSQLIILTNVAFRGLGFQPDYVPNGKKNNSWTDECDLVAGPRINPTDPQELRNTDTVKILKFEDPADKKIVGCVRLEKMEDGKCQVGMLSVHPENQAAGIGSKLMEFAETWARENFKCSVMTMGVVSCRITLIDYYKRRGYQETGHKYGFPLGKGAGVPKIPLELIVLEKSLD